MTESTGHTKQLRVVISGGGTGGHLFPALAIANQLQQAAPNTEVLFVGAKGRMEMEKVPANGYHIQGLWIAGIIRGAAFKNLLLPLKLIVSFFQAWRLLKRYRPHIAIGTGGFASGPLLYIASRMGIPTLIQEQNFYPGLTSRLLSKYVDRVCGVYDEQTTYFDPEKLIITGNPVRSELNNDTYTPSKSKSNFGLAADKPTFLIMGGSLGATTLNKALEHTLPQIATNDIQGIWQTGFTFYEEKGKAYQNQYSGLVTIQPFIENMPEAYKAADLVIARAGAITLAELAYLGKAAILVPSPNVAADHQTKNARVLENHGAAILVPDEKAAANIPDLLPQVLKDEAQLHQLSNRIQDFAKPNATKAIADEIFKLIDNKNTERLPDYIQSIIQTAKP